MNQTITTATRNFINLIYPLHCECCKKSLDPLDNVRVCGPCVNKIMLNPKPYCASCGRSVTSSGSICNECRKAGFRFSRAHSACLYEGAIKELIHSFKYKGKIFLSALFSRLMLDSLNENEHILRNIDIITFVPLRFLRSRNRAFNQSKVLASAVSREALIPVLDTLEKIRHTRPQNELSRDQRMINLKGAFRVKAGVNLTNLRALIIDDVMTTGKTLDECSGVLLDAGAKEVRCLALARGS